MNREIFWSPCVQGETSNWESLNLGAALDSPKLYGLNSVDIALRKCGQFAKRKT